MYEQGSVIVTSNLNFGSWDQALALQKRRDEIKRIRCRELGIELIEVPEVPTTVRVPKLRAFLLEICDERGIATPVEAASKEIDLLEAYSVGPLQRMVAAAEERGGVLLSEHFEGFQEKYRWRCNNGHEWESSYTSVINQETWCPRCAGVAKYRIEDVKAHAIARGGQCLSQEYSGAHSHLQWRCDLGHTWHATWNSVLQGSWCPACGGSQILTIAEMKRLARDRGGCCLSDVYVNSKTKLRWLRRTRGMAEEAA